MGEPQQISEMSEDWHGRIDQVRASLAADRPPMGTGGVPVNDDGVEAQAWEARWDVRIPTRYRHARIDQLDGDLAGAQEWDGRSNVMLLGNVGSGKTHAAVALARMAHDAGREVMFYPALALIEDLKPDGDPQALDRACKVPLLVLDDLGTERRTDFAVDRISLLIVTRYDECRPTIVTSNLAPDVLEKQVGERVWSRLYDDALRIKVAGEDRRRTA